MRESDRNFLKKNLESGYSTLRRSYRMMKYLWVIPVILTPLIAYVTGFRPPRNVEITYEEKKIDVPKQKIFGYEKDNFSSMQIAHAGEDDISVFYPNTAVKKFEGSEYEERSRQTEQIYFCNGNFSDITLTLNMTQKPSGVYIGNDDLSMFTKETGRGFEVNIPLEDRLLGITRSDSTNTNNPVNTDEKVLELFIYYKNENSKIVDSLSSRHLEDAERYLIRFIR